MSWSLTYSSQNKEFLSNLLGKHIQKMPQQEFSNQESFIQCYKKMFIFLQRSRQGAKGVLISGYNLLQRMALGLEVVLRNLQSSPVDYATKNGNFWHLAYQQTNRAIESTYLLLKNQNFPVANLPLLARNIVPLNVACMHSQAVSDLRDRVILHESMTVTTFYVKMFNSYKDQMSHRLVE